MTVCLCLTGLVSAFLHQRDVTLSVKTNLVPFVLLSPRGCVQMQVDSRPRTLTQQRSLGEA